MKKLLPYAFIILFPYLIVFLIYSLFNPFLMQCLFNNDIYFGLLFLCVFWFISLVSAIVICTKNLTRKRDALEFARTNMIIKLVQIPAYLLIFVIGIICLFTIFTFGISIILMILDCASIILSGLVGVCAVKRSHASGILSTKKVILHGILQFIFCADIVSSIIIFRRTKASTSTKSVDKDKINT